MGHEVQIMSVASGKSHPTYLYNLCGHVLSSVQIAKYLGITLILQMSTVVLVLSCTLDPQPCKLHPGLFEEEPSVLSCQT